MYKSLASHHMLIKAFLLVVMSFFTLLGASKADSKGLKKFGRLLTVAIWTIAAVIIAASIYTMVTGKSCAYGKQFPCKNHYKKMMRQRVPQGMMQQPLPGNEAIPNK